MNIALILNFVIFTALVSVFIVLRKRFPRIYEPKSIVSTVPERRKTEPLPAGRFSWVMPLTMQADTSLLSKAGLDGYFFLRYMKLMAVITLGGCVILWPILFPVYATGPAKLSGLDVISLSNIAGSPGRFYGAVLMGWIFIAFVCYAIFREYVHYIQVRGEYMSSPEHARTPQATTVLITSIPSTHLSEDAMHEAFGKLPGGIRHIYFNRNLNSLDNDIETRDKIAYKLETAQIKLIRTATKLNNKSKEKGQDINVDHNTTEDGRGTASRYVPAKKRPSHRLGFLGLIGKKVDTINWCTDELARLNPEIVQQQADKEKFKMMNSCFVEFNTQAAAQICYQAVSCGTAYSMHPRYTEIAPQDIVWSNMSLTWQSRLLKTTGATAFVAALIIFWAIPVAFVGTLSNITYLTNKVKFLRFILNCPPVLLGLITSYLPTILLAVLMSLIIPIILRYSAKTSGIPTKAGIEYAVSNTYFLFLVVQSFLVVTVVSSATAAVTQIIDDPTSAATILAAKLPTASNFYISYILLQGLAISAGALAQVVGLILFKVLGKILDSTPRKKWSRWNNLNAVGFGTLFPTYTFLSMITLTYSLIAPLILIFSAFTFCAFYMTYKYNFLYVYSLKTSTMGLLYPRALQQTIVGLYFLEVCMIGLVAVGKSYGSIVLMVIALVATILFHIKLNDAFNPLIDVVPILNANHALDQEETAVEMKHMDDKGRESPFNDPLVAKDQARQGSFGRFSDSSLPSYTHASLKAKAPTLWITPDSLGVCRDEIQRTRDEAKMSVQETGAYVDEAGNVVWDGETAPVDYDIRVADIEL